MRAMTSDCIEAASRYSRSIWDRMLESDFAMLMLRYVDMVKTPP